MGILHEVLSYNLLKLMYIKKNEFKDKIERTTEHGPVSEKIDQGSNTVPTQQ